ncbi:AsnC family transcriptional regulator [Citricoccus sp. SGAir0253]|uniref:Lrp/AsnC family transcriptional regulator n=1 Tax=Citricoccus sp. SGAir0253 TaxID=2567881 RepID=UPI0010CD344D|nr:AsnC family transcriptional regulator [Citricoccus sp. SGAir0253]QCU77987.1 AsnC family transcriptional regulator [Citricoccus sp. SGAir0253]
MSTLASLTEEDLQLVHALQIGPRLPWSTLGEVLGVHPTSLAERWRRLEDSGLAWITAHPVGQPDQMALSFHDVQCAPGLRREVAEAIMAIPDVFTIEECHRERDLMLTVIAPDPTELTGSVYPQLDRVPGLTRYESAFCTRLHRTGRDWHLDALSPDQRTALRAAAGPRQETARYVAPPPSFGPIVRALGQNARVTAAQIAEETGLHPATARRRLQKVLDSRMLAFRCDVSHHAAGYPVICQWFARLPAADHDAAAAALAPLGALRLCASTTGRTNFTFMMWLRSAADIMTVEQAASRQLPTLEIRESVIIASIAKRMGWHLHPDGARTGQYTAPGASWG